MIDYIKFWLAKALADFLILLAIVAIPLTIFLVVAGHEWWYIRKEKKERP